MNYKNLKAPKKEELDMDLMSELDLEDMPEESASEDMLDLASISDEELLAELKARGLDGAEMDEDEEEMSEEEMELNFDEEDEFDAPTSMTGKS